MRKEDMYNWSEIVALDTTSPSGLVWKISVGSGKKLKTFKTYSGKVAGSIHSSKGKSYYNFQYDKKKFLAHRIIMILLYGTIPEGMVVNHIDGNGLNNSYDNLEVCTQARNCILTKTITEGLTEGNTKSGFLGVSLINTPGRSVMYRASWTDINGKRHQKEYSVNKYGKEEAMMLAVEARKSAIAEINKLAIEGRKDAANLCN